MYNTPIYSRIYINLHFYDDDADDDWKIMKSFSHYIYSKLFYLSTKEGDV